ncbi:MAG: precorrin-6y C5,15-methyltransferase (decarboxylating) subunit CbiE, partial [Rhodospirillaceae bacterium]|nr:precorrin-6y C5,15-methyltransferase (decarboxylating) subunit CbiE [Rhodospirillaceae bacterium]
MSPWLSIIGLGEEGLDALCPRARNLVAAAEILIGGARHLALVPGRASGPEPERWTWERPLDRTVERLLAARGRRVVVLASGDPLVYGIGVRLARAVPAAEMTIIPAPSAFSLAAARLAWPLTEVECLTLHGRPIELLKAVVAPGVRLLLLSHDGTTPAAVARHLTALGYGDSRMVVLEHMGGPAEARHEGRARDWPHDRTADLNTIAVDCVAGPEAVARPSVPGLPDEAFRHDGQLTKREV